MDLSRKWEARSSWEERTTAPKCRVAVPCGGAVWPQPLAAREGIKSDGPPSLYLCKLSFPPTAHKCKYTRPTTMRVSKFITTPVVVLAFALFVHESTAKQCCYKQSANSW